MTRGGMKSWPRPRETGMEVVLVRPRVFGSPSPRFQEEFRHV